jgi:ubiquinone/menaquinone biosynthesis C-methylase UbiE
LKKKSYFVSHNTIWDKLWEERLKDIIKGTSLDWFGTKAYSIYKRWINNNDKLILDAGSGSGRFCIALASEIPNPQIIGIDISRSSVILARKGAKARKIENAEFILGDIFNLPFKNGVFDVVFNEGVIEHFQNYEDSMKEMVRVTKTLGKVIVGVPNWYCFPHTIRKKFVGNKYEYGYERSFKHRELIELFERNNLEEIEICGYYFSQSIKRLSWLYPSRISWLFEKFGDFIEYRVISPLDRISKNRFSNKFGFEIVTKGIKRNCQ